MSNSITHLQIFLVAGAGTAVLALVVGFFGWIISRLDRGFIHKWDYHNPYNRTCKICMRHEVKHCRSLETWRYDWWEVFFEGYDLCLTKALSKALSTPRSDWMKGVVSAEAIIEGAREENWVMISSNYSVVGALKKEIEFVREMSQDHDGWGVSGLEMLKGMEERLLLEIQRREAS